MPKKIQTLMVKTMEHAPEGEPEKGDDLEDIAKELCDAVHSMDSKGVAQCLRAAFEVCDAQEDSSEPDFLSQDGE